MRYLPQLSNLVPSALLASRQFLISGSLCLVSGSSRTGRLSLQTRTEVLPHACFECSTTQLLGDRSAEDSSQGLCPPAAIRSVAQSSH